MTLSNMYQAQIQTNYNFAISYYAQKRKMITNLFQQKTNQSIQKLTEYIDKRASYYWENVVQQVFNYINLNGGKKELYGKELPDLDLPLSTMNVLKRIVSSKNANIPALLGNEFENFMYKSLSLNDFGETASSVADNLAESIADDLANSLLSATYTGNIKARSAVVTGKKNIRPDIGLGFSEENKNGVGVELEGWLDISKFLDDSYSIIQSNNGELLADFLRSNAFGLSLKIWQNANNQEFSQSVPLQQMINAQLFTFHPQYGFRTTWEGQYTMDFVNYQVSKYLINIINPLNVAMVTGSGFIWMDEFLSNKMLYMQVQLNSLKRSKRGPGGEGFPEVTGPGIFIRAAAKGVNVFNYTTRISSIGKISMVKRRIKTI